MTKLSISGFELGLGETKREEYLDRKRRLSRESAEALRKLVRCEQGKLVRCGLFKLIIHAEENLGNCPPPTNGVLC